MMDKEVRDKWVKALRSGRYKKGIGRMRRRRGDQISYCCLGVLKEELELDSKNFPVHEQSFEHPGRIGLTSRQQNKLVEMNDNTATSSGKSKYSFEDIASYIMRYIKVRE